MKLFQWRGPTSDQILGCLTCAREKERAEGEPGPPQPGYLLRRDGHVYFRCKECGTLERLAKEAG